MYIFMEYVLPVAVAGVCVCLFLWLGAPLTKGRQERKRTTADRRKGA